MAKNNSEIEVLKKQNQILREGMYKISKLSEIPEYGDEGDTLYDAKDIAKQAIKLVVDLDKEIV